ncbi:MAG TPA: hypothetical protein VG714_09035 [Acidobacteriaceae bacterium]|nr:hypothetical protein [Acidobacteriaceae bacterium]
MKLAVLLAAALLLQAAAPDAPPVAQPKYLRYMRTLTVPAGSGQACAVLDAPIFPHAAPSLIDLRIFPANSPTAHEVPYAITLSQAATDETAQAHLFNLGAGPNHSIVFDLEMPSRPYSTITLDLDPALHNFIGTANVTAHDALGNQGHSVFFGSFTVFDLAAQHLSRSTTLPLPESIFPYLHVELTLSNIPGGHDPTSRFEPALVQGATVPPSREAQTIYTTVAETSSFSTSGRESIAKLELPPRVPVERVEFALPPSYNGNFSRDIRVTATAHPAPAKAPETSDQPDNIAETAAGLEQDNRPPLPEIVTGSILRVHTTQAEREIATDRLAVPVVLGANLQRPATVQIAIENGDDQPLPITAVRLQMRQRRLCFDAGAASASPLALYYGDPALSAPVYDYERLFTPSEKPLTVSLGPERPNPAYTPRPTAPLSFTERHPQVLWIALLAVIAALGFVAVRSGKSVGR